MFALLSYLASFPLCSAVLYIKKNALHERREWWQGLNLTVKTDVDASVCLSGEFLWTWYLKNAFKDFLQTLHKHPLWLRYELNRFWRSYLKGQGCCGLMCIRSGMFQSNFFTFGTNINLDSRMNWFHFGGQRLKVAASWMQYLKNSFRDFCQMSHTEGPHLTHGWTDMILKVKGHWDLKSCECDILRMPQGNFLKFGL